MLALTALFNVDHRSCGIAIADATAKNVNQSRQRTWIKREARRHAHHDNKAVRMDQGQQSGGNASRNHATSRSGKTRSDRGGMPQAFGGVVFASAFRSACVSLFELPATTA